MSDSLDGWGGAEFVLAADRLDTPDVIEAADPGDMLRQVASAAAQVRTALRSCLEADLSAFTPDARPRAIVVAGLGGAGLAGELLGALTGPGSPVQVLATRAERLPGWVGAADVVIAASGSGTMAETLPVAAEAARRGCRLVCVGEQDSALQRIAEQARAPFIPVIPAGLPGSPLPGSALPGSALPGSALPRATFWGLAIPLLVVAERLGVTRIGPEVYEQAATRLEEVSHQCRPASESFVNPGKSLALDLVGTLPVVWGTSALSGVAARRFAAQLSDNAKYPAIVGLLPEAAHSQIAAFDGPFAPTANSSPAVTAEQLPPSTSPPPFSAGADDMSGLPDLSDWALDYEDSPGPGSGFTPLRLVLIVDPDQEPRVAAQQRAVTELVGQRGIGLSELAMDGEHPLVRLAGVVQLADYASVYLAIASGIDPSQTAAITDLQTRIE
jgi:glucose/mannose-6-phosphate isomerase